MSRKNLISVLLVLLVLFLMALAGRLLSHCLSSGEQDAVEPAREETAVSKSPPRMERGVPPLFPKSPPHQEEEEATPGGPPQVPSPGSASGGFERLSKGEIDAAEDFFLRHAMLYPLDPQGHFGLGMVYRLEEAFVQSVEEFAKTLLLDPAHLQAKLQLAEMLTFQIKEDFESAEQLYQDILGQVPEERSALNGLASVYLSTGRIDGAIETWERLRSDLPDEQALVRNLAQAYLMKGRQAEEAGESAQSDVWMTKARELDPEISSEETPP